MTAHLPEGWTDDDNVIRCHRATPGSDLSTGVALLRCELCAAPIVAAPVTASKFGQPGWHIICPECFALLVPGREIAFRGRIYRGQKELP